MSNVRYGPFENERTIERNIKKYSDIFYDEMSPLYGEVGLSDEDLAYTIGVTLGETVAIFLNALSISSPEAIKTFRDIFETHINLVEKEEWEVEFEG